MINFRNLYIDWLDYLTYDIGQQYCYDNSVDLISEFSETSDVFIRNYEFCFERVFDNPDNLNSNSEIITIRKVLKCSIQ